MDENLTVTDEMNPGDWFVVWKTALGDFRAVPASVALDYFQSALSFPAAGRPEADTQRSSPIATGFTVQVTNGNKDVHLILTPLAGYAAGTVKLPLSTGLRDKQRAIVNCTQAVTALTVDGNGATVIGAPTALTANAYFTMEYDATLSTWYRIG